MKTLLIALLILTSLMARENPFEPTNAYEEESARIIETSEPKDDYAIEHQQEQQYIDEMYKKMSNPKKQVKGIKKVKAKKAKSTPKTNLTEKKLERIVKKALKASEKKTEQIVKKALNKPKKIQQLVYVKPRLDVTTQKNILPFLNMEYDNDKINIYSKYKVSKKITLPGEKKIVLDYDGKENFYTVRSKLNSVNFPRIAVGNHKKEKFFRVVINLAEVPENYEVRYDDKMVSIVKLYE